MKVRHYRAKEIQTLLGFEGLLSIPILALNLEGPLKEKSTCSGSSVLGEKATWIELIRLIFRYECIWQGLREL